MVYILGIKEKSNIFFKANSLSQATCFFPMLETGQRFMIPKEICHRLCEQGEKTVSLAKLWVEVSDISPFLRQFCLIDTQQQLEHSDSEQVAYYLSKHHESELAKQVVEKYILQILKQRDFSALGHLVHPNCVLHTSHGDAIGEEGIVNLVTMWEKTLHGLDYDLVSLSAFHDTVEAQWVLRGKHQGAMGPYAPTGCHVNVPGISLYRINDNKIIESWCIADMKEFIKHSGNVSSET